MCIAVVEWEVGLMKTYISSARSALEDSNPLFLHTDPLVLANSISSNRHRFITWYASRTSSTTAVTLVLTLRSQLNNSKQYTVAMKTEDGTAASANGVRAHQFVNEARQRY